MIKNKGDVKMNNVYKIATQILRNIKLSSDNVEMLDCYYLCANKQYIENLKTKDHQVIWGRRGTGKTTLQKAFVYDINFLQQEPTHIAIYIVMANTIPTDEEISLVIGDGNSLAVYVFSKLINEICNELEQIFNVRSSVLDDGSTKRFMDAYCELVDYIKIYKTCIQGGHLSVDSLNNKEFKKEFGRNFKGNIKITKEIFSLYLNILKGNSNIISGKETHSLTGVIKFRLETQIISELITKMLDALGIELLYICLDEYSEIDKVSEYTIQNKVAQLIKQVFFKSSRYSVKISTIWNNSKLHTRGGNRVEGIEYQQDIFAGPDLDIMFMEHNVDVITYFKEIIINTFSLGDEIKEEEKKALTDYIEEQIFSREGFRHLICGSQGVSRAFVILAKAYVQRFIKEKSGPLKLSVVYEMIKHQYLEDVRNKVPYYSLYKEIDKFVFQKLYRYFLLKRTDYERCKSLIRLLAARGVFMQMPGHLTDRRLRDKYKLFLIHYGNYLDALESEDHYKKGRKQLIEDSKLEEEGVLIPEFTGELIDNPDLYTVNIPDNIENEIYCTNCKHIFVSEQKENEIACPYCNKKILRFSAFIDEFSF